VCRGVRQQRIVCFVRGKNRESACVCLCVRALDFCVLCVCVCVWVEKEKKLFPLLWSQGKKILAHTKRILAHKARKSSTHQYIYMYIYIKKKKSCFGQTFVVTKRKQGVLLVFSFCCCCAQLTRLHFFPPSFWIWAVGRPRLWNGAKIVELDEKLPLSRTH